MILRQVVLCIAGVMAGWFAANAFRGIQPRSAEARSPETPREEVVLAAAGRTEGASDAVNVSAGIDGVLASVVPNEGQRVKVGDVIAIVDRHELAAELDQARAAAESARQAKARLMRGGRDEERNQAAAEVARATAAVNQARSHHARQARLLETDDVPRSVVDRARTDLEEATAILRSAAEREKLINAPALPEELARADAEIDAAESRIRTIQATIDKCKVRAPISGTVVRRFLRAGEVVSVVFPQPIISIVDASRIRVRAEVDERDLARVRIGQSVVVSADALGSQRVHGRVSRLSSLMGRKRVLTGDPSEKNDGDVLEVIIDLDENDPRLVIGLRVTVQFVGQAAPPVDAAVSGRPVDGPAGPSH